MLEPSGLPSVAWRHALVGSFCAALNVAIVHVGDQVLGWPYLLAAMMTCFITIPLSYLLHRRHSFRVGTQADLAEFLRFIAQQLLQFSAGLLLLAIGVEALGLTPTLAMAGTVVTLWLVSMAVQWRWVFRLPWPRGR